MLFGGHFKTQKLLGTLNLVGVGDLCGPQIRIWKDLDPASGAVLTNFQGEFIK